MQRDPGFMQRLPCGCTVQGFLCNEHRPRFWGDFIAADPAAIVAIALFVGMIAAWSAILGG